MTKRKKNHDVITSYFVVLCVSTTRRKHEDYWLPNYDVLLLERVVRIIAVKKLLALLIPYTMGDIILLSNCQGPEIVPKQNSKITEQASFNKFEYKIVEIAPPPVLVVHSSKEDLEPTILILAGRQVCWIVCGATGRTTSRNTTATSRRRRRRENISN